MGAAARPPPTCVLVHGILGSRRNMLSLAQRLVRVCSLLLDFPLGHASMDPDDLHLGLLRGFFRGFHAAACTARCLKILWGVQSWTAEHGCVLLCAQTYSSWQVLLVDLRCHGESAQLAQQQQLHVSYSQQAGGRTHGVEGAASDVLALLSALKLFPEVLIGHSFGGKVVMSMADQFGRIGPPPAPPRAGTPLPAVAPTHAAALHSPDRDQRKSCECPGSRQGLPRTVQALTRAKGLGRHAQVWVLDALPGAVAESGPAGQRLREDHPADLIPALQAVPLPIESRAALQAHLLHAGFSRKVAAWIAGNLRPSQDDPRCAPRLAPWHPRGVQHTSSM